MSIINVKDKTPFKIKSSVLISPDLFPETEIDGSYFEAYAISPEIEIKSIEIKSKEDIFKIITKREIYGQKFVLSRIYLFVDDTEDHISFYFDGFPYSYLLKNTEKTTRDKIDLIYEEEQKADCTKDDYKQIIDQLSRMIEVLLNDGHSIKMLIRWMAIVSLNPQNEMS